MIIMKKRFLSPWSFSTLDCPWEKQHPIALSNATLTFSLLGEKRNATLWHCCECVHECVIYLMYLSLVTVPSSVVPIPGTFSWPLAARGKPRRGMLRRAVFSDVQRKALEKMFQKQKYISKPDRKKLAAKLGLKDSQVNIRVEKYYTTNSSSL